jgi:hypothetical protein
MTGDKLSWLLIFGGTALHFLANWGEYWRTTAKVGPVTFAKTDLPGGMFAVLASAMSGLVLPQLGPIIGVEPPLGALAAGYMSASLGSKITALGKRP